MFWIFYSMVILNISVFAFALIYLYIFKRTHEKYIGYWGLSWAIYGTGLVIELFISSNAIPVSYAALFQQLIYSLSVLLLLAGTYSFLGKNISNKWLFLLIGIVFWNILCTALSASYLIAILPQSISFSIVSIYTGIIFLQNWEIEGIEKIATGVAFLLWGIHKSYYFYLNPAFNISPIGYIIEILLIVILNSCLFLSYLQKNRLSLVKKEQIFRLLTENSQDLIYLCRNEPAPYFEYVSPNSERIIGYSQDDFYKNPYLLDEIVHPDDKPLYELTLNPKLSPKESVTLRYRHKNGHYIWVDEYTTLVYDINGNIFGLEGAIRDVTEKKEIYEQNRKNEIERQKLLSSVSHELKTPITAIRGNIEAILDNKIPKEESLDKYLINIYNKIHLMERLINDLFELSQFESNQFSFKFSVISLKEFLDGIKSKISYDVTQADLEFRMHADLSDEQSGIELIIDIERIEQALNNLIYNAIKNTEKGGCITLRCYLQNDALVIEIEDTGCGIPENDLPHIFERFYKAKNSKSPGSGLGLAIAKEILTKHNAGITVESKLNEGTKFKIIFPLSSI